MFYNDLEGSYPTFNNSARVNIKILRTTYTILNCSSYQMKNETRN